jgi:hypothetical protein
MKHPPPPPLLLPLAGGGAAVVKLNELVDARATPSLSCTPVVSVAVQLVL